MIMDIKRSINDTRKGFEESFAAGEFYNRQNQDSDHYGDGMNKKSNDKCKKM